jgi:DNA invertase Pin-like site-specific DNA recombinase
MSHSGLRVAIYGRVSTDRQQTANQLDQLRSYSVAQGWHLTGVYTDQESGGKAERKEFKRMFIAAARREFDVVLVWSLDRFTREGVAETFQHIERLAASGVKFVSMTEEHFRTTGAAGELLLAVAAWIAKQEKERISARVYAGLERARKYGTRSGQAIGRPRAVFRRDQVADLRAAGLSWSQISSRLSVPVSTCRDALRGDDAASQA